MNTALIIRWRAVLVELLQREEMTIAEGVEAMRALDRLELVGGLVRGVPTALIKIVGQKAPEPEKEAA